MRMTYNITFTKNGALSACLGPILGNLEQVEAYAEAYASENGLKLHSIQPCDNTVVLPHSQNIRYLEIEMDPEFWERTIMRLVEVITHQYEEPDEYSVIETVSNFSNSLSDEEGISLCYYMGTKKKEDKPELHLDLEAGFSEVLKQHAAVVLEYLVNKELWG